MNKQEYRGNLNELPIENPTPEDMAEICPHLTKEQAVAAFTSESSYVACPPLRIRGAFQIVSFHDEWIEEIKVWRRDTQVITGTKTHPARLSYSYAGRTLQSYADGMSHGDVFCDYKHVAEAMRFAEDNWGDDLILDTWADVNEFYIQDPTDLYQEGFSKGSPKTKAVLRVCFNRPWNDLINDHSKPRSVLMDEAISEMTLDLMVWHELKGGRGGYTDFNCAYCSHGLNLSYCGGCKHSFTDDGCRCGWDTPLSPKMVELLLANGHVFKEDPQIARQAEEAALSVRNLRALIEEC